MREEKRWQSQYEGRKEMAEPWKMASAIFLTLTMRHPTRFCR